MLGTNSRLPCSSARHAHLHLVRDLGPIVQHNVLAVEAVERACLQVDDLALQIDRHLHPHAVHRDLLVRRQVAERDAVEARRVAGAARRVAEHDRRRRVAGHAWRGPRR